MKSSGAYLSYFSLTRLRGHVELTLALSLVCLLFPPIQVDSKAEAWPEAEVPGVSSDYAEAQSLLTKRRWPEAAIVFRSVLRANPEFSPAAMGLARALIFSGRREEALSILGQFINKEKGARRNVLIRRSRVLSRLFLTNKTFQIYQDGLNLLAMKKYRNAREKFEKALEIEPDNVEILVREGQCLVLDNDYDSAAERLRLAKRLNPFEPSVRLWLGRAMHQRGELKDAVDEIRAGYVDLPGSEMAPIWLADALTSYGQRHAALGILEEDIKGQPFHLLSLIELGRLRLQAGNRDTQIIWAARKSLQLALSRLDQYPTRDFSKFEGEMRLDLRRSSEDLKKDIQKLLQQVEDKLDQPISESSDS